MITKTIIDNKLVIEMENFISEGECDQLLSSRIPKFEKAISHYPKYYRNNDRLEEDNPVLTKELFNKVKQLKLDELKNVKRLNDKLRFCQYNQGQEFTKHQDGVYYPNENEASSLTFLLYLNSTDQFTGGETQFFNSKTDNRVVHEITPVKGKLVIFDHTLWHNGNQVEKGTKYVLRSDFIIEYKNKNHHKGYIWCLTKLNDKTFLSGGRDKFIKHWSKDIQLINSFKLHTKSIIDITNIGNNEFISSSRDMTLKKWNLAGNEIKSVKVDSMILTIKVVNEKVITGSTNGEITVYTKNLKKLTQYSIHQGWIWEIETIGNNIYSVSDDGTLRKTDLNGTSEFIFKNDHGLFSLAINEDSIFCGSKTGELLQFNMDHSIAYRHMYHEDIIRRVIIEDKKVITASEDTLVCINGKKITKHDNFVQDVIQLGDHIISAGFDGKLVKIN